MGEAMTVGTSAYSSLSYHYETMKHSGLGIASFALAIAIGILDFFIFVFAGIIEETSPGAMDGESVITLLVGLFILGGLAANMAGVGLGIAGLIQKSRNQVFTVLGLAFNAAIICGIIGLMVLGAMMS